MYSVLVTRTEDGASSLYGSFEDRATAEVWAREHESLLSAPARGRWVFLVLPVLSTDPGRRRGQLSDSMAHARTPHRR